MVTDDEWNASLTYSLEESTTRRTEFEEKCGKMLRLRGFFLILETLEMFFFIFRKRERRGKGGWERGRGLKHLSDIIIIITRVLVSVWTQCLYS